MCIQPAPSGERGQVKHDARTKGDAKIGGRLVDKGQRKRLVMNTRLDIGSMYDVPGVDRHEASASRGEANKNIRRASGYGQVSGLKPRGKVGIERGKRYGDKGGIGEEGI